MIFQQDVKNQLGIISAIVEAQPKNVIKQWRLSIFPDNDFNGSFRHMVNKITLGMICFALIAAGYKLGTHYLDRPVSASQAAALQTVDSVTPGPAVHNVAVPPSIVTKGRHPHNQEGGIKNRLDTLYKKYMRKKTDSLYEL